MPSENETNSGLRVEIDIVRDHNFYFYNRFENGHIVSYAQQITSDRAAEIIAENEGRVGALSGAVRFDDGPYQFSWTAKYRQEMNAEEG